MEMSVYGNLKYEKLYAEFLENNKKILENIIEFDEKYKDSLGWLNPDKHAGEDILRETQALADEIRASADVFVLIGVGGSNNTARALIKALQRDSKVEILYAGKNLSAYELNELKRKLENASVYINCIAKNFETLEPGSSFRVFTDILKKKYGEEHRKRVINTGTEGSGFEELSKKEGYRFLSFPEDVGGRYTAFTSVSFLAMAVAGLDIRSFVGGATVMRKELMNTEESNLAYRYACLRNTYYKAGYRLELLSSFETRLEYFYKWWIQLFAESEGKEDKGIFPISALYSEELHSLGQFVQAGTPIIYESFLSIKEEDSSYIVPEGSPGDGFSYIEGKDFSDISKKVFQGTLEAHSRRLPCILFETDRFDEYNIGALMYFFMFACYISCEIMGVNPFNQEGVEEYKRCAFRMLGK